MSQLSQLDLGNTAMEPEHPISCPGSSQTGSQGCYSAPDNNNKQAIVNVALKDFRTEMQEDHQQALQEFQAKMKQDHQEHSNSLTILAGAIIRMFEQKSKEAMDRIDKQAAIHLPHQPSQSHSSAPPCQPTPPYPSVSPTAPLEPIPSATATIPGNQGPTSATSGPGEPQSETPPVEFSPVSTICTTTIP